MKNPVTSIICLGDSNTFGYMLTKSQSYPYLLAKAVESNGAIVINKGINGNTTQDVIDRLEKDVVSHFKPYSKNIVLLQIGTNDIGFAYKAESLFERYKVIVESLKDNGFEVWALSVPPRNDNAKFSIQISDLNAKFKKYDKISCFVDLWAMFADESGYRCKDEFILEDGVHLSFAACKAIAEILGALIIKK